MTVLVVEPMKEPYVKEIDPDLHSLQAEVCGDIGATYPYSDPVALVCNDEGKFIGLDLNRGLRDENGEIYDIVAGTFLVVGLGEEDFASLSPELIPEIHGTVQNAGTIYADQWQYRCSSCPSRGNKTSLICQTVLKLASVCRHRGAAFR